MIYNNIKHDIIECKACPLSAELDYGCTPQWGMGNKSARLLILNLRSSQESHLIEKPFETKYSLLLKKLLAAGGIAETDVFVTNLIKCKCQLTPVKQFKANAKTCKETWIPKELESLSNVKVILCLGKQTNELLQPLLITHRVFQTHSLEEIFRKGQSYTDDIIKTFKAIKEYYAEIEKTG